MIKPDKGARNGVQRGIRSPIVNEKNLTLTVSVLASPLEIDRRQLDVVERFFKAIDEEYYASDITIGALIHCIKILCEDRREGADYKDSLLNKIDATMASIYNDVKENIIIPAIMASDDITPRAAQSNIAGYETQLRYYTIFQKKDKFSDLLSDLTSGSTLNIDSTLKELENTTRELNDEFMKIKNSKTSSSVSVTSSSLFANNQLFDAYRVETSPIRIYKTGLKKFNEMLSVEGGFLSGKYYMFYANINNFKSTLLLYIAKWIMQYNGDLFKTDSYILSGKKPTVVFVSLENPYEEDTSKLFTMVTHRNLKHMKSYEEARRLWEIKLAGYDSPISITMIHPTINTFTISELRNILDNLKADNYDPIAVVIDYLEGISPEPEDRKLENRMLLTKHSEMLHYIASRDKILVASAMQINRIGSGLLNELKNKKQTDHVTKLGREHIGESYGIDKKTDWSAFINLETIADNNTKRFFTIKREKSRYEKTETEYFVHPVNGITFKEDFHLPGSETYSQNAISAQSNEELAFSVAKNQNGMRGASQLRELTEVEVAQVGKEHKKEGLSDATLEWLSELNSSDDSLVFDLNLFEPMTPFDLEEYKLIDTEGDEHYFSSQRSPLNDLTRQFN